MYKIIFFCIIVMWFSNKGSRPLKLQTNSVSVTFLQCVIVISKIKHDLFQENVKIIFLFQFFIITDSKNSCFRIEEMKKQKNTKTLICFHLLNMLKKFTTLKTMMNVFQPLFAAPSIVLGNINVFGGL